MELIAQILTDPVTGVLDAEPIPGPVCSPERRTEPRFPTNRLTVVYSTGPNGPERMFCTILDVSKHGMRVRTARPMEAGTTVRVTLREVSAVARICYCKPASDGFDHGVHVEE